MRRLIAAACIGLTACVTPPMKREITSSRTYQKPFDAVWEDLVAFFATNNIQIKNIAKDSGVIYAEMTRFDDPALADCGKPGMFRVVGAAARFNVFVSRTNPNAPTVSVNGEFGQQWRFGDAIHNAPCYSTGVLEQRVLDSIK